MGSAMEMAKPGKPHEKLSAFEGKWAGPERMHPAPWMPEAEDRAGSTRCKRILDGFFVEMDYVQKKGKKITYQGKGIFGWDAATKQYTCAWFDSMGGGHCEPARGEFKGNKLSVTAQSEHGRHRYSWAFPNKDRIKFRMEMETAPDQWQVLCDGTYDRVG